MNLLLPAVATCGTFSTGNVLDELRDYLLNFLSLNGGGDLDLSQLDELTTLTYSSQFSSISIVLEYLVVIETYVMSGEITLDQFETIDLSFIDWSVMPSEVLTGLLTLPGIPTVVVTYITEIKLIEVVQITYDYTPAQLTLSTYFNTIGQLPFIVDNGFASVIASINIFLQQVTFPETITVQSIEVIIMRFLLQLKVDMNLLVTFHGFFTSTEFDVSEFTPICIQMNADQLEVDVTDIDISTVQQVSLAPSVTIIFNFLEMFKFDEKAMDAIFFALSVVDLTQGYTNEHFLYLLAIGGCPTEVVNQLYYILSSPAFHVQLVNALELAGGQMHDMAMHQLNIYQTQLEMFIKWSQLDISFETIMGISLTQIQQNNFLEIEYILNNSGSFFPLAVIFSILNQISSVCLMPEMPIACPVNNAWTLFEQVSFDGFSWELTYWEFTYEVYADVIRSCGAPDIVIQYLLNIDIYNFIMQQLPVPPTTTTMATTTPAPSTEWDCDQYIQFCTCLAPTMMKYGEAAQFCHDKGGELPRPENDLQNKALQKFGVDLWLGGHVNDLLGNDTEIFLLIF